MSLEGRLDIDLYRDAGQVRDVSIRSTRPLGAVNVLRGKTVDEVLETLPLLYSVCGTAQAMAAVTACEQALAIEVPETQARARGLLLHAENAREHMIRILLDWPAFTGRDPAAVGLSPVNRLAHCLRAAIYPHDRPFRAGGDRMAPERASLAACLAEARQFVEREILGLDFDAWQAIGDEAALLAWLDGSDSVAAVLVRLVVGEDWSAFGRAPVSALPPLDSEALHRQLGGPAADDFVSRPRWQGEHHETTPLTRQGGSPLIRDLCHRYGNGLLPRLVARLQELVADILAMQRLAAGLGEDAGGVKPGRLSGTGLAQVEAARGRLIHRVEVNEGRVARYQVVAPTEWNFHPRGLLAQALDGYPAADGETLFKQATLLVNAIDPCVACRVRVH